MPGFQRIMGIRAIFSIPIARSTSQVLPGDIRRPDLLQFSECVEIRTQRRTWADVKVARATAITFIRPCDGNVALDWALVRIVVLHSRASRIASLDAVNRA